MTDTPIPQADPRAGFLALRSRIDIAMIHVIEGGHYVLGREVLGFEQEFSAFVGAGHGIGVANGTDALLLALKAIEVGPQDYVATVSHTAVATVAAIELAGAKPLLIDIDPATMTLDPQALAAAVARPPGRIAAVIPVHLYGQPADLGALGPLAARAGAALIEDAAQAHGALWGTRMVGSVGRLGTFSFYPTKNLPALGDGGMVVTGEETLAERVRALRQYGWRQRYVSELTGINSRLDELQAAILRVRLTMLEAENQRRRDIAAAYDSGLAGLPVALPARRPNCTHVFHQYVLRSRKREALQRALTTRGIGTNIHYPVPVHLQPAYKGRLAIGPSGLAETERAAEEVLSLPMFPQLAEDQIGRVIAGVHGACAETD
ncbi:MAG TPA: DegT/DnrJ/EryC1/StrS family aminotransferase [Stellaceae bacterium]|nr:DegT/DnrJ/EryC1/StrS family aminotransferase [Stellaceae bacterium]